MVKYIGSAIGKMHDADIVHGDLTTSNIMLKREEKLIENEVSQELTDLSLYDVTDTHVASSSSSLSSRVVMIDFGLGMTNAVIEDKAVDLYVLERAFTSTHPHSSHLVTELLGAYRFSHRKADSVLLKLEQ
eukprot:CAMPEP_0182439830 /NCGR_PEP_ID=MMETSP1167-20130531/86680_1 /TAXON_ID=2988 /ORGANISM="Mallomonas Sp, Strain CCMP3275" /LENGTH=130 /DNA_ID=CAMNT_0024633623 /DNA_START=408 /DNA_END=797 /DNA_ORIENTATION=-